MAWLPPPLYPNLLQWLSFAEPNDMESLWIQLWKQRAECRSMESGSAPGIPTQKKRSDSTSLLWPQFVYRCSLKWNSLSFLFTHWSGESWALRSRNASFLQCFGPKHTVPLVKLFQADRKTIGKVALDQFFSPPTSNQTGSGERQRKKNEQFCYWWHFEALFFIYYQKGICLKMYMWPS